MSMPAPPATSAPARSTPVPATNDSQQTRVRVPRKERMKFFRQFATCIKAGLSVAAALKHLEAETSNRDLKEAARKAQICVERGGKLSAWMKTRPVVCRVVGSKSVNYPRPQGAGLVPEPKFETIG